jgi:hypothetical protein
MSEKQWDGQERRADHREFQQDVSDRLRALERQVIILTSAVESQEKIIAEYVKTTNTLLNKHDNTIYGDGTLKGIGYGERLNNLERVEKGRQTHFLVLTGAVIAGFVKMIFDFLTKQH